MVAVGGMFLYKIHKCPQTQWDIQVIFGLKYPEMSEAKLESYLK